MKRIIYSSLSVLTAIGTVFVAAKAEVFSQNGSTPAATEEFTAIESTDSTDTFSEFGNSLEGASKDSLSSLTLSGQDSQGASDLLSGNGLKSASGLPSGLSSQSKSSTKPGEQPGDVAIAASPSATASSTTAPTGLVPTSSFSPSGLSSPRPYGQFSRVPVAQVSAPEVPTAEPTAQPSVSDLEADAAEMPEAEDATAAPSPAVVPASPTGVSPASPIPSGTLGAPIGTPTGVPETGNALPAPGANVVPASPTGLPATPADASPTGIQPVTPASGSLEDEEISEEDALSQEMPEDGSLMDADAADESSSFGEEPIEEESFGEEAPIEDDSFEAQPSPDAVDDAGSIEMEIEEAPEDIPEATPLPSAPGTPVPASPDGSATPVPSAPGAPMPSAPGTPVPAAPGTPVPSESLPPAEPSAPIEDSVEESLPPIDESLPPIDEGVMEDDSFPASDEPLSDSGDRLVGEGFTPFQLSYLAVSGGLKEAGIPGGHILIDAYKEGDISAEDVVNAGAATKRLGAAASNESGYTESVDDFLKMLVRDDRTT